MSDLLLKLELIPNRQTHRIVIGTDTSYLIQREIIAIDLIVTALITYQKKLSIPNQKNSRLEMDDRRFQPHHIPNGHNHNYTLGQ